MDKAAVAPNLGSASPQKSIERVRAFEFALAGVGSLIWGAQTKHIKK
jgi:hypothetical protein